MKVLIPALLALLTVLPVAAAPLFEEDFNRTTGDQVPDNIMVLDGQFAVKEEAGNRFLELPGSPLETFGVLFGPSVPADVQVQARFWGNKVGRKFPTFAAGLNGVSGYKLRVSPGKGALELVQGADAEVKATVPFTWKSGEWISVKLQVKKSGTGVEIVAKAWQGPTEPAEWSLKSASAEALPAGKAGVWGMPFSGTAVRFDDLRVTKAE